MRSFFIALSAMFLVISCDNKSRTKNQPIKKDSTDYSASANNHFDALIDSLRALKPAILSISEERSDRDKIIPIGYNHRGSFAYFLEQDMGGAVGYEFHIQPVYDIFSVKLGLDMEMLGDSVLDYHKDVIGYSLRTAGIKINNTIQRISVADLEKKYRMKISINKNFGLPHPDYDDKKKTLASVSISHIRDGSYPTHIINEIYPASSPVWDCYVSDIILVPTKDYGMFAFAVIVTESLGFEGYTRKSIELVSLGDLND